MSVRPSRVSTLFEANDDLTFRDEGSGTLSASGGFGSPINLSDIGSNNSPVWANNVRQGRAQINIFIEDRNSSGTCAFTIKLADNAAIADPSVIMGPVSVPPNYAGLLTIPFDLGGQGLLLADPLFCAIEIALSGGAVCGGFAWLGPRVK